ncbi:TetR/AcrR family transcriptional regulator [Mycolicibacterium mucogenicum]|uniref:TetR/AcrR family transcriptional regulator n=1 Tax=Mycolicibacterium TaxID=1866885 RepID=UPI0022698D71|nr:MULTISPECIES: TetR/AcrR family transcriptional regulator [Mycolicibacterium]MCX8559413.1 TetR/AcrR family transcriptional regulator [Mycolicibacterium mucogenicum]
MFDNGTPALPTAVQRRGIERVQAILDAAEALLTEQGYEAATLKAIGERAGIPTASLYHYFPDRHQVDAALAQRHLRELDAQISASVSDSKLRTLSDAIDAIVDPYLIYFRAHPDFVQLWFASRTPGLNELALEFDEFQARRFWQLLVDKKLVRADTPELVVQLAFEAGNRLFDVAFRRSPGGDDVAIDEARSMLTAYLGTYAPKATKPRRPK